MHVFNSGIVSVFYRKFHISLIFISFISILIYSFFYESVSFDNNDGVLLNNELLKFTYAVGFVVVVFGFLISVYYEIILNEKEKNEQLGQHVLIEEEIKVLRDQLPYNITSSLFYNRVKNVCDSYWEKGDLKEYLIYANLQKELLAYTLRINNSNTTISWREEMYFVNKLIELMKICNNNVRSKVELFEISSNYRFPIGLFVIPLFEAIESSMRSNECTLRVECFSKGGLWNCKIATRTSVLRKRGRKLRETIGFNNLKKRVNSGNWAIKLTKMLNDENLEVNILGRYAS